MKKKWFKIRCLQIENVALFCPFYRHRKYGFSKIDFDKSIVKSAGSRNALAFFFHSPFWNYQSRSILNVTILSAANSVSICMAYDHGTHNGIFYQTILIGKSSACSLMNEKGLMTITSSKHYYVKCIPRPSNKQRKQFLNRMLLH